MASAGNDVVIDMDVPEWVSTLKKKVEAVNLRKHRRDEPRTIFRVPSNMREGDPAAYVPKLVSFGPFWHRHPALRSTDQLKLRYLQRLLLRNPNAPLDDYIKLIKELEPRSRSCYSEHIDMDSNEFVEMMLLDGCFFVEILLMQTDGAIRNNDDDEEEEEEEDPILNTNWTLPLIEYDMLMLENQIPFFVIERVFELASSGSCSSRLIKLLLSFFDDLLPSDKILVPSGVAVPKFHHVLHFLHSCVMPEVYQNSSQSKIKQLYKPLIYLKLGKIRRLSSNIYRRIVSSFSSFRSSRISSESDHFVPPTPESVPCATMLKEAGVKFKEKKARSFLDVAFNDGVMEIPTLQVYAQTNSLFRNLIAFEQCLPEVGTHVATYAFFMDCLIDKREDVALLHRYGCVVNGLGNDDDAALLFNRLCKEVAVDYGSCYLAGLFGDVKRHCDSRWNKWRAKLMHDYFSNPWAVLSLAGALILIVLTVIQALFAILSYFRPLRESS